MLRDGMDDVDTRLAVKALVRSLRKAGQRKKAMALAGFQARVVAPEVGGMQHMLTTEQRPAEHICSRHTAYSTLLRKCAWRVAAAEALRVGWAADQEGECPAGGEAAARGVGTGGDGYGGVGEDTLISRYGG